MGSRPLTFVAFPDYYGSHSGGQVKFKSRKPPIPSPGKTLNLRA